MPLIAEYNFENQVGGTYADISGNGFDLTRGPQATDVTGYHGSNAIEASPNNTQGTFGAGAYRVYPGGSPLGNPVTLLMWAKIPDISSDAIYLSAYNDSGRQDPVGIAAASDGSVYSWWYDQANIASPSPISITPGLIANNTWAHIAAVFIPGTSVTLYVNGVVATTYGWQGGGSNTFYNTWETLLLGSSRWGSDQTTLDDVRIYNEALSGPTITTLMNTPVGGVPIDLLTGTNAVQNMYLGTTQIVKVYAGSVQVYG